jgi:hypothetical protein
MITSENITLQNKCTKAYESNNINNYILCSNNDAVKDDDGRRYFILDIATHKVGDRKFYDKLYNECFCKEVGEAFFHYVYSIDTNGFNPQSFPITQSKKDSLSKRLDSVYKFLKDEYILKKIDIDCSAQDLYTEFKYNSYSNKMSKEDFHRKMTEAGFTRIKKENKLWYEIKHKILLKCANSKLWLHELDEFEEEEEQEEQTVSKKKISKKYDNKYELDFVY